MAPRLTSKASPKVQRSIAKTVASKQKTITPANTMAVRKPTMEKISVKDTRQRTSTVPKAATPKPKENKTAPLPGSVTKSAVKSWKRRPKPAHSGVPVPEKMRRILEKQLQDSDCSL